MGPLIFRVGLLFVAGIAGFGADALFLNRYNISLPAVFGVEGSLQSNLKQINQLVLGLTGFWLAAGIANSLVNYFISSNTDVVLWIAFVAMIVFLLRMPRFRRILLRVAHGGLSVDRRLGDVLFADALISFAPILVDLVFAMTIRYNGTDSFSIERTTMGPFVILVASIPSGIRIKQCFSDWRRTKNSQHLFNLLKYVVGNIPNSIRIHMTANPEFKTKLPWALAVSSVYSLYWDVRYDWQVMGEPNRRWVFPESYYNWAIIIDTFTRFGWVFALPDESRIFTLQLVELLRRTMWVVFRVESEPQAQQQYQNNIELPVREPHAHAHAE